MSLQLKTGYTICDIIDALVHSDIKSKHIERDITIFSVTGLSHTSEWEDERIRAMKEHYTDFEIFKWRILPKFLRLRQLKNLNYKYTRKIKGRINRSLSKTKTEIKKIIRTIQRGKY